LFHLLELEEPVFFPTKNTPALINLGVFKRITFKLLNYIRNLGVVQ